MPTTITDAALERASHLRRRIEAGLERQFHGARPESLYEPARYVLTGGGKRLRPLLVLLTAEGYGAALDDALPAALGVEVFHNFTLVHDDIMDHADTRRGRPTVHVRWDVSTAILAGDLLMARAFELVSEVPAAALPSALGVFNHMVPRLCEGQALDKAFETHPTVATDEYLSMIDCKTAALLQCALELGAVVGGAPERDRRLLRRVGRDLGRAFQIQDDLLDLVADDDRWGKTIGGDLVVGKKTFLLLRALELATGPEREWFERIVRDGGLDPGAIDEARQRMDRLGVLDEAREAVRAYSADADAALDELACPAATQSLRWLVQRMRQRLH